MQTVEATRDLGIVDRSLIEARLHAIFECRASGDIDGMMSHTAPDIVCFPRTNWRYGGFPTPISGREAVREAFRIRNIQYENLGSTIHRILIDGNDVAVHRTSSIRERGGSRSFTYDAVDFIKFREGLVIEFLELPDGSLHEAVKTFPL